MPSKTSKTRTQARAAARLGAVQALYQHDMEGTAIPALLHEFHQHRLGATIEDVEYADADIMLFDDIVKGVDARRSEVDAAITERLASGWTLERLDKPMRQILRCGTYELIARHDIPKAAIISEYLEIWANKMHLLPGPVGSHHPTFGRIGEPIAGHQCGDKLIGRKFGL